MHFWIDKRSSYGIGHNRSLAGLSYQHRRIRTKPIVVPARQNCSTGAPSSFAKPHNHHRNRQMDFDHRSTAARLNQINSQHQTSENSALPNSHHLSTQQVPAIHSVYTRHELPVSHLVDPIENSRSCVGNYWLPIYLKGGICVTTALTLLTLKLYYDNVLTAIQLLIFGSTSLILMTFIVTITLLRMRRMRNQSVQRENIEPVIQPVIINQMTTQSIDGCIDHPPPYAVAVTFPEKHATINCSPPPSYEKINII